ncbi:hypothetical protein PACTADRAFT_52117 [Pachysolen tannophilus NRRL Y-2460]|uniref:Uncharacterized protein n=1 Tax=Pachysolen tannophilus NRRL Y-2460 TaxID=669874 RepID=A0A1E4TP65_PACTA|nr:hypothetical protein PACTADRAFT_52117 [Pachysolen tannophilus NRRL Y-2460]
MVYDIRDNNDNFNSNSRPLRPYFRHRVNDGLKPFAKNSKIGGRTLTLGQQGSKDEALRFLRSRSSNFPLPEVQPNLAEATNLLRPSSRGRFEKSCITSTRPLKSILRNRYDYNNNNNNNKSFGGGKDYAIRKKTSNYRSGMPNSIKKNLNYRNNNLKTTRSKKLTKFVTGMIWSAISGIGSNVFNMVLGSGDNMGLSKEDSNYLQTKINTANNIKITQIPNEIKSTTEHKPKAEDNERRNIEEPTKNDNDNNFEVLKILQKKQEILENLNKKIISLEEENQKLLKDNKAALLRKEIEKQELAIENELIKKEVASLRSLIRETKLKNENKENQENNSDFISLKNYKLLNQDIDNTEKLINIGTIYKDEANTSSDNTTYSMKQLKRRIEERKLKTARRKTQRLQSSPRIPSSPPKSIFNVPNVHNVPNVPKSNNSFKEEELNSKIRNIEKSLQLLTNKLILQEKLKKNQDLPLSEISNILNNNNKTTNKNSNSNLMNTNNSNPIKDTHKVSIDEETDKEFNKSIEQSECFSPIRI